MKKALFTILVMTMILAGVTYVNTFNNTTVEPVEEVIILPAWVHNDNMLHEQGMINFNKLANDKASIGKEVWKQV